MCSSFVPSGDSLKRTRDPPEHVRGLRVRSLAVPTTTYHSASLREAKVQTATLEGEQTGDTHIDMYTHLAHPSLYLKAASFCSN